MPQYWVLQANPKEYFKLALFLQEFIQEHPSCEDWWQVGNQPVRQGDCLFMWKADGCEAGSRGIYAVALATTGPKDGAPRTKAQQLQLKRFYAPKGRWVKERWVQRWEDGTIPTRHVDIVYKYSLVDNPVLARPELEDLWGRRELPGLETLVRIRNRTDSVRLRGKKILSPALPESEGRFLLGLIAARASPLCSNWGTP